MATAAATKPLTADEFFDWVHEPANRDRFFELERGEIIEMPPPGKYHGFVCCNIAAILRGFAVRRRRGYVCTNDSGIIVERDPDTVRGIDVSFYDDVQSAANMDRKYAVAPPILAAEIMSPSDRVNRMVRRAAQLLNRGVKLVWIIDPESRDVGVFRPGQAPETRTAEQELSGGDVLPDFACRVADFFDMPGEVPPPATTTP